MRWSQSFIPTLRDAPADAEAVSHKLLMRGGFIRQLHAGHYSLLPLGLLVHQKVERIVRECMDEIGAQECLLPAMHPAWLWQKSGRWETMGLEMFRLRNRQHVDMALGMTHEEAFADLAREVLSYKMLPQIWYQIQWKFRDEPRPKAGLLRVREFAMKDSYSFDLDEAGLDRSFKSHHRAYTRIFSRLSLDTVAVEASSGAMGGSASVEFMVPSPAGEDDIVCCDSCDYAANIERATSVVRKRLVISDVESSVERFHTPGVRTIAALEAFCEGVPAASQIKTMVMKLDGAVSLVLMRGDHKLNLQKLSDGAGAVNIEVAESDEIFKCLGAYPGSLGPVAMNKSLINKQALNKQALNKTSNNKTSNNKTSNNKTSNNKQASSNMQMINMPIYADFALKGEKGLVTGANIDDWHYRNVDIDRDVNVDKWLDLREVAEGEQCIRCGGRLDRVRCIEVGHIFKLGTRYAEAFNVAVLDDTGEKHHLMMGSYGIGIGRTLASIAETHHDARGLIWPEAVAPYEVVITVASMKNDAAVAAGEEIYMALQVGGVDVLLDDRDARAGVKFTDAELIGIPWRVTIGRSLAQGEVEVTRRTDGSTDKVPVDSVALHIINIVREAKSVLAAS